MHGGTGHDQVSDPRQSAESLEPAAHGHAQSGDLGNASGDQRRLRVIPVAQAVGDTRRQSHHIFQGCPQLNTQHVRADIDTEHFIHKDILQIFRRLLVLCSHDNRGGNPPSHFLRMGRTGKHRHIGLRNLFFYDLGKGEQRFLLDTLRHIDNHLSFFYQRRHAVGSASRIGRRHRQHQHLRSLHRLL